MSEIKLASEVEKIFKKYSDSDKTVSVPPVTENQI